MRRVLMLCAVLLLITVPGWAQNGGFIRYHGPTFQQTSSGSAFFPNGIGLGNTVASPYANLYGDAANVLSMRNGGTAGAPVPQTFNVYNFCDGAGCATGYERGGVRWATNLLQVFTEVAGTGTSRSIYIFPSSGKTVVNGDIYSVTNDVGSLGMSVGSMSAWSNFGLTRSIQGSKCKALTAGAATTFVQVAVPQTDLVNFASGEVIWNVRASDATDIQTLQGRTAFNCVNKTGTESCAAVVTALNTLVAASGGAGKDDLACTFQMETGLADKVGIQANCASAEMTETSLQICYRLDMPQPNTVTPQ